MDRSSSLSRPLIALFIALAGAGLAGCGTVGGMEPTSTSAAPAAAAAEPAVARPDLSGYTTVVVGPFRNASTKRISSAAKREEYNVMVAAGAERFAVRVTEGIRGTGRFANVGREAPAEGEYLKVEGDITAYDEGNAAARLMIGLGAGSSNFDVNVRFVDGRSGNVLATLVIDRNSWPLGGMMAAGQTMDSFMEEGARKIVTELGLAAAPR